MCIVLFVFVSSIEKMNVIIWKCRAFAKKKRLRYMILNLENNSMVEITRTFILVIKSYW